MTTPQAPVPPGHSPPVSSAPPVSPSEPPAPEPPRGPGVLVPFAAPPRDQDRNKVVLTTVLAIVVGVFACTGLVGGTFGVLVWASTEMSNQASDTAGDFLDEIVARDYDAAYSMLCERSQESQTMDSFTAEWDALEIRDYTLGEQISSSADGGLVVPAEVSDDRNQQQDIDMVIELDPETMEMSVCDW